MPDETNKSTWRWVVLAVSFLSTLLISPVYLSFGTFVLSWMTEFNASGAAVALVASSGSAICGLTSPLGSLLIQRWGYRISHVIGSFLMVTSFALSSIADSLWTLFFTFSIVGGTGASLCSVAYVNAVSEHLHDNQGMAFPFVTSGYGIGGIIFPLIFQRMIHAYTWRGAMFVISAILGNNIALGLLLYPVGRTMGVPSSKKRSLEGMNASSRTDSEEIDEKERMRGVSAIPELKTSEKNSHRLSFVAVSCKLLRSSKFYILFFHNLSTYMGFFTVFTLTPIRAVYDFKHTDDQDLEMFREIVVDHGLDNGLHIEHISAFTMVVKRKRLVALLISGFGISQLVFRLLFGVLAETKLVRGSTIYIAGHFFFGLLALASLMAKSFPLQLAYCILSSAAFASVSFYFVLVYEIFERDLFNAAFGYLEIMHGFGIFIGPVIGGAVFDLTGTCQYSFILAGVLIFSGLAVLVIGMRAIKQDHRLWF